MTRLFRPGSMNLHFPYPQIETRLQSTHTESEYIRGRKGRGVWWRRRRRGGERGEEVVRLGKVGEGKKSLIAFSAAGGARREDFVVLLCRNLRRRKRK
jgi:hypothetical protein